jgi:hypothetical protein
MLSLQATICRFLIRFRSARPVRGPLPADWTSAELPAHGLGLRTEREAGVCRLFGSRSTPGRMGTGHRPELVLAGIGRAVGTSLAGTGSTLDALAEQLGDGRWLLILDNLEQVVNAARNLDELLARCPGVTLLATSRTVLGLRAEREYPVPPLPLPAGPASVPVDELVWSNLRALSRLTGADKRFMWR